MNNPLANAFPTSCFAIASSCCGSAAEAITKSTGKSPPPGSGGGVSGIVRMPGIFDSGPIDSISSCCAVLRRSLHGFVTMPPKPPEGPMIWKMLAASGIDRYTSCTWVVNSFV